MRRTAFLVDRFSDAITEAQGLVSLAESSTNFTFANRCYVYEAAYLLIFSAWEGFLEEAMIRFIAGYGNSSGSVPLQPGKVRCQNIAAARSALFGSRSFLLWHSPDKPIDRSKLWFVNGPHEMVISRILQRFDTTLHIGVQTAADSNFDAQSGLRCTSESRLCVKI